MTSHQRSLGIMCIEWAEPGSNLLQPEPGSMLSPATYDFPIITETITGAWAEDVIRGNPGLESAYVAAARRLVDRGAVAITADCGFSVRHQQAVAKSVDVPVSTSSLLMVSALLRQLPASDKLAVLTFDSKHLSPHLLGIEGSELRERVIIGGTEGGKFWRNEMNHPPVPTDSNDIETDVANCIARLRKSHPEISAILFECTGFALVSQKMRQITQLPIYDIIGQCNLMMASIG